VQQNYPEEWGSEDHRVADAVERLGALAAQGVRTIVDLTVVGLGRYIPRIARVAEQVPELNIIVATGIYTYTDVPFFFYYRGPALNDALGTEVPDPMVDMFVRDITEGIADTGVKAGMLKCAIDQPGMTAGVERVMRAVARAHHQTGTPITVHTHPESRNGLEAKRVLCDEEGVAPPRVVLGHSGDSTDCDHLAELADAGFLLGMDRFGINLETTFEARADTVIEMCRRGYAERMVLSQDTSCYIDWVEPDVLAFLPQWHYLHIGDDVLPYLREHGVTDAQIDAMLVEHRAERSGGNEPRQRFRHLATWHATHRDRRRHLAARHVARRSFRRVGGPVGVGPRHVRLAAEASRARPRGVIFFAPLVVRRRALKRQLTADNRNVVRRLDAQADRLSFRSQNGDDDRVADTNLLLRLPC
jgi:phosphotriesterase-related protein